MIDTKELRKLVHRHAQVALSIQIKPAMLSEILDRLEAAEKERDAAELMPLALRAKIAEMEKQEPFGGLLDGDFYEVRQKSLYSGDGPIPGQKALYALPGAKGE